ncbi:hypothetical protein L596_029544 [Steinernema carpocapsae]|uniref:Tetratricopeptide repeat protein 30 n=1 Tax=Steinernema carpocapsae TaxID=34508 RepID=A0A4U5LUY6_STECR|nr:hypothetical protein L596_029544 [Steinernema carpocapsae]
MSFVPIKDGEFTSTIYGMIKDDRYADAMRVLQHELQRQPNNRGALSLLGYCYFYTQDFPAAAECYEQLVEQFPEVPDYKIYYAQSLYNAFMCPEAIAALSQIDEPGLMSDVIKLHSAIKYRDEDHINARILIEQYPPEDPDTEVNLACIEYKEKNYTKALERFQNAVHVVGYKADLAYAIALCHYQLRDFAKAISLITNIIDRGIKDHPELSVGLVSDGIEVRSVGNSMILHETALIEAFNLKCAIEYKLKNMEKAASALTDMPPRSEDELDPVTLHNQALVHIDTNPNESFSKLQFLLTQNPFPPETFCNLLLLYCKYDYYELAADVLAENAHLTYKHLTQNDFDYLDALITQLTSPTDAYNKFDMIASEIVTQLRKSQKRIENTVEDTPERHKAVETYEKLIEGYVPVLMSQAKIIWDQGDYPKVEKILQRGLEFIQNHSTWQLNVAHVIFMQEKFREANAFYSPLLKGKLEDLLSISPVIIANLCVSYIMSSLNEEAEEVMRQVELEEESADPEKKTLHICIINLVIGTLYCSKGNFEFGITRIIKAMDPLDKKLSPDTWFYCKRCLMAMIENSAKQMSGTGTWSLWSASRSWNSVKRMGRTQTRRWPDLSTNRRRAPGEVKSTRSTRSPTKRG